MIKITLKSISQLFTSASRFMIFNLLHSIKIEFVVRTSTHELLFALCNFLNNQN